MKMVKSLILGSAAGLFAVAGAQAADLPVKAKAVEYVKVCSLYGAGFYYIPGTDTCIKIGGFVRTEWNHNAGGSFGPYTNSSNARFERGVNTLVNRSRIIVSFDVRSQTEYGTLRAYARAGWQWTTGDFQVGGSQCASSTTASAVPGGAAVGSSSCTYLDRAFIQFAGFTFGKTQSYFDFFNIGAYSLQTNWLWVDTGGSGTPVAAYTAQFGNGVSATLSFEDASEQRQPVINLAAAGYVPPIGGTPVSSAAGQVFPDIVGNIRVDQAWGSAQVMGAAHSVRATYYTGGGGAATDHPGDKWGWAFGGGLTLKMPWDARDTISGMVTWCEGAARYCSNPSGGILGGGAQYGLVNTTQIGVGWQWDAVYIAPAASINGDGSLQLSRMFSGVGAFEHYWTPTLRTSVYGGYLKFEANSAELEAYCLLPPSWGSKCYDWSAWEVGTRTLWNPVANLDVGVDVLYTKINSAHPTTPGGTIPVGGTFGPLQIGNTHVWAGILRIQRNFWP